MTWDDARDLRPVFKVGDRVALWEDGAYRLGVVAEHWGGNVYAVQWDTGTEELTIHSDHLERRSQALTPLPPLPRIRHGGP